jgi:hypothetical protein
VSDQSGNAVDLSALAAGAVQAMADAATQFEEVDDDGEDE